MLNSNASSRTQRRTVVISNKLGLHARAAAKLVQTANAFTADLDLEKNEDNNKKTINGKSILGVMMLAAAKGTTLDLIATGEDAEQALDALEALINDKFGEDE